jgi:hypothetical protein
MPQQEEIKRMLASGLKYELDALANKDFRYLNQDLSAPGSSKRRTGWTSAGGVRPEIALQPRGDQATPSGIRASQ